MATKIYKYVLQVKHIITGNISEYKGKSSTPIDLSSYLKNNEDFENQILIFFEQKEVEELSYEELEKENADLKQQIKQLAAIKDSFFDKNKLVKKKDENPNPWGKMPITVKYDPAIPSLNPNINFRNANTMSYLPFDNKNLIKRFFSSFDDIND